MRLVRARLLIVGVCLLGGCGDPDPEITRLELRPRLPTDPTCEPTVALSRLRIAALGDFPSVATDQRVETVGTEGPETIDRFPVNTELVTVMGEAGTWSGGGLHRVSGQSEAAGVLLLPFGRSCVRQDALELRLPEGGAVVALPDGGLAVFGGEGTRRRSTVRAPAPGTGELARVLGEPLSDPRVGATATLVGERVLIAGGEGEDNDTFDVFDLDTETVDFGLLPGIRHHHGAIALDDERVLLVGGMDATGAVLATATIVDVEAGEATALDSALVVSRSDAQLLRLDDGTLHVVGGQVTGGGLAAQVELFDQASQSFVQIDGAVLQGWEGATAVALPGARIAWLGGEGGARAQVLALESGPLGLGNLVVELDDELPAGDAAAVALDDGRILLVGEDEAAVVDVGRGTVEPTGWSRAAAALLTLADGSIAELDTEGASLRRELLRTPFDNPPNTLLPTDAEWVALDAAPRWRGGENVSDDQALAVVPTLLFSDFRVTPVVDGPVDLLLRHPDGESTRILLDPDRADVLGCDLEHAPDDPVTIERRANQIVLLTRSGLERTCRVDLPPRVGLALRVYPRSTFTALSDLERL